MQGTKGVGELRQARALDVECEDCGRTRRFQRRDLLALDREGVRTFRHLGSRLTCRHCRDRSGSGKNVTLKPRWFSHLRLTGGH
jgi:hypothetical protein